MSIHVISWVLKHSNAKGNDRMALLVFAEKADEDGSDAYPSAERISYEGRMARSTAIEARKRLVEQGRLLPDGMDPYGFGIPNFRVRMDLEAEGPPPAPPKRNRGRGRIPDPPLPGSDSGPGGSEEGAPGGPGAGPEPSIEPSTTGDPSSKVSRREVARRVFVFWAETLGKRRREPGADDLALLEQVLAVGSEEEARTAIAACEASDYHRKRGKYAKRNGQRYDSLGHIFKPRATKGETWRSRLDFWLDRAEEDGAADGKRRFTHPRNRT